MDRPSVIRKSSNFLLGRSNTFSSASNTVPSDDSASDFLYAPMSGIPQSSAASSFGFNLESLSPPLPALPGQNGSYFAAPSPLDSMRKTVAKRIKTFAYLKRAHEGRVHWFNTILLTRDDIEKAFDYSRMTKKTTRFAVLGMSMSTLLEINSPQDYLKNLLGLLVEFDAITDENFRPRKSVTKLGRSIRKPTLTSAEYPVGLQESGELSCLYSPNIPFDLDYIQVFFTLCDILTDVYSKILVFLGDKPPQTTASSTTPTSTVTILSPVNIIGNSSGDFKSSASSAAALIDVIIKIDGKLKKLVNSVMKDVDTVARQALKDELNAILTTGILS